MSAAKRLRIFAGPNGSGKSTLFTTIAEQFRVGHFINADDIEKEIATKGFIYRLVQSTFITERSR